MTIQTVHSTKQTTFELPPLNQGDQLTRAEFERIYEAHPEIKKAELVEGVVYMPSPARHKQHGEPHGRVLLWLGAFAAATPGVEFSNDATVRLDLENEVQPDALLRLDTALGGASRVSDDDYIEGAPELVVEIAASSAAYDLHQKKRVYQRSGVREYLAFQMHERHVNWFVLREGVYESLGADEKGNLQSAVFPGLWLNVEAFWKGDLAAMLATAQEGAASQEHGEFVTRLEGATRK